MVGRTLIVPFVNQVGKTDFPEERPTLSKQRSPPSRFRTGPPPSRNHRNRKRNGKETNHNRSLPSKCVYLFLNRGPPPPGGRGVTREPFRRRVTASLRRFRPSDPRRIRVPGARPMEALDGGRPTQARLLGGESGRFALRMDFLRLLLLRTVLRQSFIHYIW